MNKKPLVSIILPTHNRAKYIKKAIESVLSQTYKDFEFIIIDDGSTDETPEIISEYRRNDPRIKILTNKSNLGLVKSLNKGIRNAQGKYIARIDDDDFWCDSQKLKKQTAFLEANPDYVLVGGGVIKINEEGQEIVRLMLPQQDKNIRRAILQNNPFVHSSVVFRKEVWDKAGEYNEGLASSNAEDWDLWMRFGEFGKFYNFQDYFLRYLQGGQNKTTINDSVLRRNSLISNKLRIRYRNHFPGFWMAYLAGWGSYFYFCLPHRKNFHSLLLGVRRHLFRQSAYKEFSGGR